MPKPVYNLHWQRNGELFQFRESAAWIDTLGVRYEFGVDGIALLLG